MTVHSPSTGERRCARRRPVLAGAGVVLGAVAGCLGRGESAAPPAAVALPDGATCDVCGMVVRRQPGPTAEVFYADRSPAGHENPARFDSAWEAYRYDFEREERGWERTAFYVTDYSGVDYTVTEEGGDELVSTHPQKEAFAPVEDVTYVVGAEVKGAMGEDLVAFTDEGDAESFRSGYGGDLVTHDEVTPEVVAGLGRR